MISSGDAVIGGLMGRVPEMGEGPDVWSVYLDTPDEQATCDKAVANGGAVLVPPMPVGELGTRFVIMQAPAA
jgi:predicted enzyme related to lactoylglutathione lyase